MNLYLIICIIILKDTIWIMASDIMNKQSMIFLVLIFLFSLTLTIYDNINAIRGKKRSNLIFIILTLLCLILLILFPPN